MKKFCFAMLFLLAHYSTLAQKVAVVLQDNTPIMSSASKKSKEISALNRLRLVNILEISKNKEVLSSTKALGIDCTESPWIKIKTQDNVIGWVHGNAIFEIIFNHTAIKNIQNKNFALDNQIWQIALLRNFSMDKTDEDKVMECSWSYPILIYTKDFKSINVIEQIKNNYSNNKLVSLNDDAGGGDEIKNLIIKNHTVRLNIFSAFQEGSATYSLEIKKIKNKIVGAIFDYKRKD